MRKLHDALEAAGRESWVDWEGIPPTAEWMEEIRQAIEAADTFVAVLSPASVTSEVCRAEIVYAAEQGKRLIPIVAREVEPGATPEELAKLNWIFFRDQDDFDDAFAKLIDAHDTDLDHLKLHTWLLVRCARWSRNEEEDSFLLRGRELETAENWLAASADKQPAPTRVQSRFILEGRRRETRRQRRALIAVVAALVVSISLGLLAWSQRNQKERQRKLAVARALATRSELALDETGDGLVRSALLAVESLVLVRTDEGDASWERAMKLLPPPPMVESPDLGETTAATVGSDSRLWAAGDGHGYVTLGELAGGQIVHRWQALDTGIESLAFSADLAVLAVGGRGVLAIWDVASKTRIAEIRGEDLRLDTFGRVHDLVFSHDGDRLFAAAESFGIDVFSTDDWRRLEPLETVESRAFALAIHPTRDLLVAGGFGLTLLDPRSGDATPVADTRNEEIDTLTFSREGDLLASVDLAVRIWDVEEGEGGLFVARPVDRLAAADERAHSLDFSPGGRYLAVARETGVVHVRAAKTGAEVNRIVESHPVWHVTFDAGSDRIVTISDRVRVRQALTGDEIHRSDLGTEIERAFFVGSGAWLVAITKEGALHSFDPDGLRPRPALELGAEPSAAQSPDRRWLAAMGRERLFVIDGSTLETRAELELPDSTRAPKFLFDPESRFVVATGTAGASVLDLRSLQWYELIAGGAGRAGWRSAFTANGHWLVLGAGETTRLFRTPNWGALPPVNGSVLAFDQQGTRLCTQIAAVRGRHPGYHVVWELASGQRLGSVGLGAYQGRTAAEYGESDIALAEQCEGWEPSKLVDAHPEPVRETPRWRVERDGDSVLLFGLQPNDRIAEACRRIPRPLTPDEWTSLMGDEDYQPTCPEPPLVDSPDV